MNKESFSLIGIRLIAIYLIASGLVLLPNLPQLWVGPTPDSTYILGYVLALAAPLAAGIILFAISMTLSKLICKGLNSNQTSEANTKINEFHGIALSIAGLMILAMKFPDFIGVILQINQTAVLNNRQAEYFSNSYFLSELLVLVLGVSLLLGAKFWINFYRWFQQFGLKDK
jgi:hypothetical protein